MVLYRYVWDLEKISRAKFTCISPRQSEHRDSCAGGRRHLACACGTHYTRLQQVPELPGIAVR